MTATRGITPSQTVGPFFRLGLDPMVVTDLARPDVKGRVIAVHGIVRDGAGDPVPDAIIETWQADSQGRYPVTSDDSSDHTPAFRGFARVATDERGQFAIRTIKPGPVAGPDDTMQSPHLAVAIFMRGLLRHLITRIYFSDDAPTGVDPVLALVDPSRRDTLIARADPAAPDTFEWDVHLQGPSETVFFDI
jgi:protocatechuate 3,4-dioxygenase alpha subunit